MTTSSSYKIERCGPSRSFADSDPFSQGSSSDGDALVVLGHCPIDSPFLHQTERSVILVELDKDCLAIYADEDRLPPNVLGFARWRLGSNDPSKLIELVRHPESDAAAIESARAIFQAAGLETSICQDRPGRIVDRLIRPQFNLALHAVDEDLATPEDLDLALKMGLGYRQGILQPLLESGLADHHDVTQSLFATYGLAQFAPPRRALVAKTLREQLDKQTQ